MSLWRFCGACSPASNPISGSRLSISRSDIKLAVFNRQASKPKLRPAVRLLWVALLPLTGDPVVLESTLVQTTLIAAKHLR